jgi:F-type H+-transporting ATPase subunit b
MALLRVDPGLVLWLWITFGIILVILRFTVWGRITGALDKRSERIAADLEAARQAGEKAGAVQAQYADTLRAGREEAAAIIEEARAEAARLREGILAQSQAEAREMRERAAHEITLAREDAQRELRGQVISLSFSIADSILKRETGGADNRALAEQFADRLLASPASGSDRN